MKRRLDESPRLLRVLKLSGEELATIPVEELSDVRSLKQHLQKTSGLPPRFRQKLLRDGVALDDAMVLDSPMDLNLVVLPLLKSDAEQAKLLIAAVIHGDVRRVNELLDGAQDPDDANLRGETPLHLVVVEYVGFQSVRFRVQCGIVTSNSGKSSGQENGQ